MGLLKTAAKVAVASSVHGRVQRRQQMRWAAQDQNAGAGIPMQMPGSAAPAAAQPAPVAESAPPPDKTAQQLAHLTQLGELKKAGVLTEAEFEQQKAQILGQ
jgi:hypothetical protein